MKINFLTTILFVNLSLQGAVLTGPVINPANGHYYSLLNSNSWTASQAEALILGGNLVTINNAAENDWVFNTFSAGQRNLWIGFNDGDLNDTYTWVDGSALSYSNWDTAVGQPDLGPDRYGFIIKGNVGQGQTARKWHDIPNIVPPALAFVGPIFGVVEQATPPICSPHRAMATATLANGFVIGAALTDGGCGYTNAPIVFIQGGGGSNATATAVVSNGVVVSININNAGCCYTNVPQIVIASPWFPPTVSIKVSKVKVTLHVVLGLNYVLESSINLSTWDEVAPPFTATSESITNEFDVDPLPRYFRIRQVN